MAEPLRRAWPLSAQVLLAALVLALAAFATRDGLHERERAGALAELAGVLPAAVYDNDPTRERTVLRDPEALGSDDALPLWRARRGGRPSALVVDAIAQGYGGPLRLRIGIARDGTLLGVRVIGHGETRGLGDAFEHDGGRWLGALAGRSLRDPAPPRWTVRRDGGEFDQFGAATVTPRAILVRVRAVLDAYAARGDAWFAAEASP